MGCDSLAGIVFHTRIATFLVEEKQRRQGRLGNGTNSRQPGRGRTGTGQNKGTLSTRLMIVGKIYYNIIDVYYYAYNKR